ncbi:CopG family transcriptional regulator [Conexibacter sp. SYSU D00693]|uniref:ribbon-helix-helix domain-containing protein n=1 Tax=Conexibacter sp. SYSU D00693 TaxID=2812560 RepID=UPI00196A871F|nr:CopG family transcriptional regulator [Conexibacter sp. SYSU D00693]
MKKTSLYLEPELDEALARRATEEGLTKAELIRRTLAATVARPPRRRPRAVGVLDGPRTLSTDPEAWR